MKRVIAILDLPPRRAVPTVRESVEAAAERWNVELHWIRRPLQPCHPFWQKMFVCGDVAKRFGPSHVLQIDNDMVIRSDCPSPSSWLNLASSQWLPNGSAPKTESTTAGGKRLRTRFGPNVVDLIPRRLGCIPTVVCICMTLTRLLACSSESFST